MIGAILGGFTILGAFLTFAAWLNGSSTKRFIAEESHFTQQLIRDTISKISEHTDKVSERIAEHTDKVSERIAEHIDKVSEQIERIPEKTAYLLKEE